MYMNGEGSADGKSRATGNSVGKWIDVMCAEDEVIMVEKKNNEVFCGTANEVM